MIKNVVAKFMSIFQDRMVLWAYCLSSKNIQINTITEIKEYVLLLAIIHELTHALWFNDHRNKTGYAIWKQFNGFNEWVTQKITEEVADEFWWEQSWLMYAVLIYNKQQGILHLW